MIGFAFFVPINYYKRWPTDKANHTCENMLRIILCVIQGVKIFDKVTSWPQLISNLLIVPACLQCCFCLALHFFILEVFLSSIRYTMKLLHNEHCGTRAGQYH